MYSYYAVAATTTVAAAAVTAATRQRQWEKFLRFRALEEERGGLSEGRPLFQGHTQHTPTTTALRKFATVRPAYIGWSWTILSGDLSLTFDEHPEEGHEVEISEEAEHEADGPSAVDEVMLE